MHHTIVFAPRDYDALRGRLFADLTREQAAILLATSATSPTARRLIVREVLPLSDADYLEHEQDRLVITPHALARAMKEAARRDLSLLLAHTHPDADDRVGFSPVDDMGEARVFAVAAARVPGQMHASLVFGRRAVAGRMWEGSQPIPIDRVVVAGLGLQILARGGAPGAGDAENERYDRQVRAFGADGQRHLADLHVGVVGCGGTGSAVAEQLLRSGVGHVLAIDPDVAEDSNVTRVYSSTAADATHERYKVHLVARTARKIGRPDAVEPLVGDVRDEPVARRLIEADVVLGCTDSHWSRLILNRISTQYLIPLIDLGSRVDARDGTLRGVAGRVSVLLPGDPCLFCAGVIRPEIIATESLPEDERRRQLDEGYIQGLDERAPAVISLNTAVAGLAVTELLRLTTGWGDGRRTYQLVYNALEGTVRPSRPSRDPACWCGNADVIGCGDGSPLPCRPAQVEAAG